MEAGSLAPILSLRHDVCHNYPPVVVLMWLSSTAQQAIHAVVCVAAVGDEGPVRVDEIAAAMGCPRNYLSKTLHALTRAGVLVSGRGPKGGFRLAEAPDELPLARVVAPFELVGERRCLMGRPTCGDASPCAAHHRWSSVAATVESFFGEVTVGALLSGNPRAAEAARTAIHTARLTGRRPSHGPVARSP